MNQPQPTDVTANFYDFAPTPAQKIAASNAKRAQILAYHASFKINQKINDPVLNFEYSDEAKHTKKLLKLLAEQGPQCTAYLARQLGIPRTTIQDILAHMLNNELLKKFSYSEQTPYAYYGLPNQRLSHAKS